MTFGSETNCLEHRTMCAMNLTYDTVAIHQKVFEWMVLKNNAIGVLDYF